MIIEGSNKQKTSELLFLLVFAQGERMVAAGQSTCALRQHLLTSLGQFVLVFIQTLLGLIQFALLLSVLFLKSVETRLKLKKKKRRQ